MTTKGGALAAVVACAGLVSQVTACSLGADEDAVTSEIYTGDGRYRIAGVVISVETFVRQYSDNNIAIRVGVRNLGDRKVQFEVGEPASYQVQTVDGVVAYESPGEGEVVAGLVSVVELSPGEATSFRQGWDGGSNTGTDLQSGDLGVVTATLEQFAPQPGEDLVGKPMLFRKIE